MNQALSVYSSWLAATVGKVKLIGESREFDLEKIFVELTIFEEYRRPTDKDVLWSLMDAELRKKRTLFPPDEDKRRPKSRNDKPDFEEKKVRRVIQPDQLIKPGTRALVVGAPGCGKTTLMRWLTWMTHNHGQHLPVFLELKTVARALTEKRPLGEILIETITGRCFQTQSPEAFKQCFSEQLKNGNVTILLDGLDEISDQKHLLQDAIRDFLASLPRNLSLIVSTRSYALTSAFAGLEQMEIAPLTDQQMSNFLKHYYQDRPEIITGLEKELEQQADLHDLARVPFLLGVIAWLYREHGVTSDEPLKLYDQLVKQLAGKLDEEKGIQRFHFPDSKDHDTKREFLAFLASERLLDRTRQENDDWLVFSEDEIKETAARFCRTGTAKSTDSISLAEDVIHTALLREVGLERYTFIHLTIHEYLGAKALARDKRAFCRAFFNPTLAEMEVLPMALGMASDPDSFYEALEHLPESLDLKNLRVRARGLRYTGSRLSELRINHHADRMMEFVRGEIKREETLYTDLVIRSFSRASNKIKQVFSSKLLRLLWDENWSEWEKAAGALVQLGEGNEEVVSDLLGLLRDEDSWVRSSAAGALGELGEGNETVVSRLLERLRDEDSDVRASAAGALGQLGEESDAAVNGLLGLLRDEDSWVRESAAGALGELRIGSEAVVTALLRLVRDKDSDVRASAAEALGELGIEGEVVVTALLRLVRDEDSWVRESAAGALGELRIGSEAVVTALLGLVWDETWGVRESVAGALGELGVGSEAVVTALLGLAQDENSDVRESAAWALGELGVGSEAVVTALLRLVRDKKWSVRARAAGALGQIGVMSEVVVNELQRLMWWNTNWIVRFRARIALVQIGVVNNAVVIALVGLLQDGVHDVGASGVKLWSLSRR